MKEDTIQVVIVMMVTMIVAVLILVVVVVVMTMAVVVIMTMLVGVVVAVGVFVTMVVTVVVGVVVGVIVGMVMSVMSTFFIMRVFFFNSSGLCLGSFGRLSMRTLFTTMTVPVSMFMEEDQSHNVDEKSNDRHQE